MTFLRPILLGLAFGAVCFGLGRFTSPPKLVERVVTKTVTVEAKTAENVVSDKPFTNATTKTRIVYRDGKRVEVVREVARNSGAERITGDKTSTVTANSKQFVSVIEKPVPVSKPRYSLGAFAGTNLKHGFSPLPPSYGVTAGLRLFGNLWGDVSVDIPGRGAMLGLKLEF